MPHKSIRSGKTIRFKTDSPRHANAIPYKRIKHNIKVEDFDDYEN